MLEHLPQMVWVMDPEGRIVYVNPAGLRFVGDSAGALGLSWLMVVEPSERDRVLESTRGGPGDAGLWSSELRLRRHDGAFRRMRVLAQVVRDDADVTAAWIGTCVDVEDERRVGDELRRQALETGLLVAAHGDAGDRERARLASIAESGVLAPLRLAAARLRAAGAVDESIAVERAAAALRMLLGDD